MAGIGNVAKVPNTAFDVVGQGARFSESILGFPENNDHIFPENSAGSSCLEFGK